MWKGVMTRHHVVKEVFVGGSEKELMLNGTVSYTLSFGAPKMWERKGWRGGLAGVDFVE